MAQIPIGTQIESVAKEQQYARQVSSLWQQFALSGILLLSAFLNLFRLKQIGYGNTYYAAAVRSMLISWHNFFFVSFDPAGFVSVDKPPLGFWIQTASAKLLGFSGFSILLPEVLAAILSVALLYYLVRRVFGPIAGLLAALALALTPISVVTARNNTIDSLLVLTVLLAAWAVIRAAETGRLRWLLLSAVLVGLGFNIKMAQAYLVVPAFGLLYLLGAPLRWQTRIGHLALAGIVLLVVSLSWAVAVDLTPASQRPYVGSSGSNSELSLAFGYNGLNRLLGNRFGAGNRVLGNGPSAANGASSQQPTPQQLGFFGAGETGAPGPLRLLNEQLGGQVSWLLPIAILGLIAAAWQTRPRFPLNRRQKALVLWGTWLLSMVIFFSVAGFFHSYYMVMLSPAICALFGIGIVTMWQDYRCTDWRRLLLPLSLLGTAAVQAYLLLPYSSWNRWLIPLVGGPCFIATAVLVAIRLNSHLGSNRDQVSSEDLEDIEDIVSVEDLEDTDGAPTVHWISWFNQHVLLTTAVIWSVLALLITPLVWSAIPVFQGNNAAFPVAGPGLQNAAFARFVEEFDQQPTSSKLVQFLQANQGQAHFLVATLDATTAAPIILASGQPVMALGGFSGADAILTTQQLVNRINNGEVRFFLLSSARLRYFPVLPFNGEERGSGGFEGFGDFAGFARNQNANLTSWVSAHCNAVPTDQWQSGASSFGVPGIRGGTFLEGFGERLFDCGNHY